jgi:GNAT superfamily N-acetyltransferase
MSRVDFELETIDEADVGPELDEILRALLCECFPADMPAFARQRHWNGVAPEFTVLGRSDGELAGQLAVVVREVLVGGHTLRVAGVQSFAVRPRWRKSGLSGRLMARAMEKAAARGLPFGLLLCVPGLESFYARHGWRRTDRPVFCLDAQGQRVSLSPKNICMYRTLTGEPFPEGELDLCGRDW